MAEKIFLDVEGYLLFKAGKIELLQEARELFRQRDSSQQQNGYQQKTQLTAQDHIVNQVTHDERLRNTKQRGHQDQEDTHCTLAVVSANKRAQVLKAGFYGRVAVLPTNTVLRKLARKP